MNKTKKFVEMIVEATKSLLAVLDNVVLSDDIIPACRCPTLSPGGGADYNCVPIQCRWQEVEEEWEYTGHAERAHGSPHSS